jgi:hypothetical protein
MENIKPFTSLKILAAVKNSHTGAHVTHAMWESQAESDY